MRIEHTGRRVAPRDALALQIGDMAGQRRGAIARAGLADDPRLDHHPPPRALRGATTAKAASGAATGAAASAAASKAKPSVTGRLDGPSHLPEEAPGSARPIGADAAWPQQEIVVELAHERAAVE
jgi:hypothetical protein